MTPLPMQPITPGPLADHLLLTDQLLLTNKSLLSEFVLTKTMRSETVLTDTKTPDHQLMDHSVTGSLLSATSQRTTCYYPQAYPQTPEHFLCRFQLQLPPVAPPSTLMHPRMAAVLLPVIRRSPPTLLLTVRSLRLKRHQGQIAFPGGVYENGDRTLSTTALRETEEEIAIPASAVQLIGTLPALDSTSGFRVTPFVGLISPDTHWQANTAEVADIFEIPLPHALAYTHYHSLAVIRQQRKQFTWFYWYQKHCIWGITAKILYRLAAQVAEQ